MVCLRPSATDLSHPTANAAFCSPILDLAPFRIVPTGSRVGSSPVQIVVSATHEAMERRPLPIANSRHQLVLLGVPVHVVNAALEISFVSHRMFPVSLLPESAEPMRGPRCRLAYFTSAGCQPRLGEFLFDSHPAQWVPCVTARQSPNGVPVIAKQDNRHDFKRMIAAHLPDRVAEAG